jgi:hypothetical protein
MKKPANFRSTIEQLRALQVKARGQFEKITEDAAGKPPKTKKAVYKKTIIKRKLKPAVKRKPVSKTRAKTHVRKVTFWKRIFRIKTRTVRRRTPMNRRMR